MKFMKWSDFEPGDVIKFNIDCIIKDCWASSFVIEAKKHNAEIIKVEDGYIYVKFILENGKDASNACYFPGHYFDTTSPFEIIELVDDK